MYDWLQVTIPARAHVYRLIPVTLTVTNPADRLVILIATAAASSDSRKHVIVSKVNTRSAECFIAGRLLAGKMLLVKIAPAKTCSKLNGSTTPIARELLDV